MKEPRDEFLEQIKSTLLGHEEPYDEGAWERFAAKNITTGEEVKKVIPIWKWAAAAAAALIGAVLLLQYFNAPSNLENPEGQNSSIVKTENENQSIKDTTTLLQDTTSAVIANAPENNITDKTNIPNNSFTPPAVNEIYQRRESTVQTENKQQKPAAEYAPIPAPPLTAQVKPSPQKQQTAPAEQKPADKPFWENNVEKNVANNPTPQHNNKNNNAVAVNRQPAPNLGKNDKTSRWASSLYVSPNFSNEGINMGYGYSLGYAVNDKIKVSSGIAYTKVSTSKNFDAPASPNALAMEESKMSTSYARSVVSNNLSSGPSAPYVQSMDSWISGIDVPVEITYNVNKKMYATGGVSGLFIMNGENTKKMVRDLNSRAPITNAAGTVKGYSSLAEESKPEYQTSKTDANSFLGFYNVSMGYKQKISNKNSVSVEPFIKVPMKQVSEQKLNFTGVGVRLKFDF